MIYISDSQHLCYGTAAVGNDQISNFFSQCKNVPFFVYAVSSDSKN